MLALTLVFMTSMNRDDLVGMIAQLDQEISSLEAELLRKRAARNGAVALLAYVDDEKVVPPVVADPTSHSGGDDLKWEEPAAQPSEIVLNVFREHRGQVLSIDDVEREANDPTGSLNRERIRNAAHYLVRKNKLERAGRGKFVLKNASAPEAPGAEGTESTGDSTSDSSDATQIGGGTDGSVPLPSRDEDQLGTLPRHDDGRDRPSIEG